MAAPEGNKNAAKENRMITNALRRAATQNPEKLQRACEAILNKAADGDIASFNVYADRLEGKPVQGVELSGEVETKQRVISARPIDEDEWEQRYTDSLGSTGGATSGTH